MGSNVCKYIAFWYIHAVCKWDVFVVFPMGYIRGSVVGCPPIGPPHRYTESVPKVEGEDTMSRVEGDGVEGHPNVEGRGKCTAIFVASSS